MVAHKWRPIVGLPNYWPTLSDGDLADIKRVWSLVQAKLQSSGTLATFIQRVRREWSIETGVIEGIYSIDKGVTESLIEHGIDAAYIPHGSTDKDPEFVAQIVEDQADALELVFSFVKSERTLTVGFIRELHAALVRNQPTYTVRDQLGQVFEKRLEGGVFKALANNPRRHEDGEIHEYCPPDHTSAEMDQLVRFHAEHENAGVTADIAAAWLHHAFTQIHPFPDGNGRVARALASAVLVKTELFPLTIERSERVPYIECLEKADMGDLRPLIRRFHHSLRRQLAWAQRVATDTASIGSIEDEIAAIEERLVVTDEISPRDWPQALGYAKQLSEDCNGMLNNTLDRLNTALVYKSDAFSFGLGRERAASPIAERVARELGYGISQADYHDLRKLTLRGKSTRALNVSFDSRGSKFRGLIAVCAYLETGGDEFELVVEKPFLIHHHAKLDRLRVDFTEWMTSAIAAALRKWGGGV